MNKGNDVDLPDDLHEVKEVRKGSDSQEREHDAVTVQADSAAADAVDVGDSLAAGIAVELEVAAKEEEEEEDVAGDAALVLVVAVAAAAGCVVVGDDVVFVFAAVFAMTARLAWSAGPCWTIRRDENLDGRVFFHSCSFLTFSPLWGSRHGLLQLIGAIMSRNPNE